MRSQYQNLPKQPDQASSKSKLVGFALLIVLTTASLSFWHSQQQNVEAQQPSSYKTTPIVSEKNLTRQQENQCSTNNETKLILVSVAKRHLWACEGTTVVHDTPVITGNEQYPETMTPRGTYHVYAKQQNTTLTGSDSTGTWKRPVNYWMPFLDNKYGTYGFHDATWRKGGEFGTTDPNTEAASHGCPELPLAAQKWLYNWAPLKTAVIIEN